MWGCFKCFSLFPSSHQGPLLPGGAHRCVRGLPETVCLLCRSICVTREGDRSVEEEVLAPCCQEPGDQQTSLCPLLAAGPYPLSSLPPFFFIFFLGVGFKLSCFVYITPKFCGIKDLQVQICPAFINFPSLFNLCDFNFPSLYC